MTDRYAVVGNPVAHSLSPRIHAAFARETSQDIEYTGMLAPLDAFKPALLQFRDDGGRGVNVTLPFKYQAWQFVDAHARGALEASAVNTIHFHDGKSTGYNTDGVGLVTDLQKNLDFAIYGKRVLIMGAGGASYGVMYPLLTAPPQTLVVANRTFEKAEGLVRHFERYKDLAQEGISARRYEDLAGTEFDLVINATSAGLTDQMPSLPVNIFAPDALAYDMVYGKETPFMRFSAAHGIRTTDGLGMLVEQAAESFWLWRAVRPQTAPVIAALRNDA